jgi:hypothetical protein
MVLLESKENIQKKLQHFQLNTPNGAPVSTSEHMGDKGCLIIVTCNHCPYAQALWERTINDAPKINALGFSMLAINPNINPDYPEDNPQNMQVLIDQHNLPFPYLVDVNQSVVRDLDAQCTPEFFLVDTNMNLIYHGAYDNNWKDPSAVTEQFILSAMESYINTGASGIQKVMPSIGCSIKWINAS